jgi:hypothetical protein
MPGFSLWLVPRPASPEAAQLRALIASLSAPLGAPVFAPHVTLLGVIAVAADGGADAGEGAGADAPAALLARARALARSAPLRALRGLRAGFACAEGGATEFRCVYLRLDEPALAALLPARAAALASFPRHGEAPGEAFMPHLSVLYSTALPAGAPRADLAAAPEVQAALHLAPLALPRLELWDTTSPDAASWSLVEGWELCDGGDDDGGARAASS